MQQTFLFWWPTIHSFNTVNITLPQQQHGFAVLEEFSNHQVGLDSKDQGWIDKALLSYNES